jgi:hypothetical protein
VAPAADCEAGFRLLERAMEDHHTHVPLACAPALLQCVAAYARQTANANVAFAATALFWRAADLVRQHLSPAPALALTHLYKAARAKACPDAAARALSVLPDAGCEAECAAQGCAGAGMVGLCSARHQRHMRLYTEAAAHAGVLGEALRDNVPHAQSEPRALRVAVLAALMHNEDAGAGLGAHAAELEQLCAEEAVFATAMQAIADAADAHADPEAGVEARWPEEAPAWLAEIAGSAAVEAAVTLHEANAAGLHDRLLLCCVTELLELAMHPHGDIRNTAARLLFKLVETHAGALTQLSAGAVVHVVARLVSRLLLLQATAQPVVDTRSGFGGSSREKQQKLWVETRLLCVNAIAHMLRASLDAFPIEDLPPVWVSAFSALAALLADTVFAPHTPLSAAALAALSTLAGTDAVRDSALWPLLTCAFTRITQGLLDRLELLTAAHTTFAAAHAAQQYSLTLPPAAGALLDALAVDANAVPPMPLDKPTAEQLVARTAGVLAPVQPAEVAQAYPGIAPASLPGACLDWLRVAACLTDLLAGLRPADAQLCLVLSHALAARELYLPISLPKASAGLLGVCPVRAPGKEGLLSHTFTTLALGLLPHDPALVAPFVYAFFACPQLSPTDDLASPALTFLNSVLPSPPAHPSKPTLCCSRPRTLPNVNQSSLRSRIHFQLFPYCYLCYY